MLGEAQVPAAAEREQVVERQLLARREVAELDSDRVGLGQATLLDQRSDADVRQDQAEEGPRRVECQGVVDLGLRIGQLPAKQVKLGLVGRRHPQRGGGSPRSRDVEGLTFVAVGHLDRIGRMEEIHRLPEGDELWTEVLEEAPTRERSLDEPDGHRCRLAGGEQAVGGKRGQHDALTERRALLDVDRRSESRRVTLLARQVPAG